MTSSMKRALVAVAGLLALAACGPNMIGSRYVKSQEVGAGQSALITVSAAESPELAGTRMDIPVGALGATTTVTVELGLSSILGSELAAGPVAVFGPAGTTFSGDVIVSLPVTGIGTTDDISIVVEDEAGLSSEIDANQVALNAERNIATFRIRRLATFQPRRRVACNANSQCAMGLVCVNGRCQTPPTQGTDGGTMCPMSCPSGSVCDPVRGVCTVNTNICMSNADCPTNLACVNHVCTVPSTNNCGTLGCPNGQVCNSGMCVALPSDGGTTNPNVCMSDADCAMGERCFNGVCRAACIPQTEICNMVDDDCDGIVDENCNLPDGGTGCGGIGGLQCASGEVCVDDPNDMCTPSMGADCPGICVVNNPIDGGIDAGPSVCRTNMDCGVGESCINGVCMSPSTDGGMGNPDGGTTTDGGTVTPGDGGMSNPDAGNPQDGGSPNLCRTTMDCASGQNCVMGVCR
jgi:Cys-rich repeat protein